jgi:thioredoxin-related protein
MRVSLILAFVLAYFVSGAQTSKPFNIYNAAENADQGIRQAIETASRSNKHVLIQIGGNWCSWCARFHKITTEDRQIDSLIRSSYVVYHLNYSKENKNQDVLAKYSYPQRFGFPVFLILDGAGKLLHTQNSAYLEQDKGYSREKILDFLNGWTKNALDPERYNTFQ